MSIPAITPLPDAPSRGDTEATFTSKANAFVAALPTLVTEINAVGDAMETTLTNAQTAETNAETAETNAETAQAAAELAAQNAASSANFQGEWSSLVGALNVPASVSHNNFVWLLLTNLADVTTSEPSTANSDWLLANPSATSLTLEITANTNGITAGNVVELVSTGGQNVQNIYHCEAPTIGSLATLSGTNNCVSFATTARDSSSAFLTYGVSGVGGVIQVVTQGNPPTASATLATDTRASHRSVTTLSPTECALACFESATNLGVSIVTAAGTNTPTKTPSASIAATEGAGVAPATCSLTSSNWFVAYADTNSDANVRTAVSNGTNAPTLGTARNLGPDTITSLSLAKTTTNSALLVLMGASSVTLNISGGTTNAPTESSPGILDGTNNCTYITQSPIDSNHTLCAYNNATTSNGMLAVIQANGTNAPTVISRAVFDSPEATYIALTAHSSNQHSLLYRNNAGQGRSIVVNVDSNYNLTFSQSLLSGPSGSLYNAIAALTPTTAIAAFQGANSDGYAGTLTLTPTPVISGQLVGIAETSATNGADATVAVGPVYSTTNSLTLGADYYANGAGGITVTPSPILVGKAESTNTLLLDLRGNPAAGKQLSGEITVPGAFTWVAPFDGEYLLTFSGGGGSGALDLNGLYRAAGGNSGSVISITKALYRDQTLSGNIGAGGTASVGGIGSDGGTSTLSCAGVIYTAAGGLGGRTDASGGVVNRQNAPLLLNIPGGLGMSEVNSQYSEGGVTPLLSTTKASTTNNIAVGVAGLRGSGGSGSSFTASGKGGDGVFRWELVLGSGK